VPIGVRCDFVQHFVWVVVHHGVPSRVKAHVAHGIPVVHQTLDLALVAKHAQRVSEQHFARLAHPQIALSVDRRVPSFVLLGPGLFACLLALSVCYNRHPGALVYDGRAFELA